MNRRNHFLTALAVAALTFGSLYGITGPPKAFAHRGDHYNRQHCGGHHHERDHKAIDKNQKTTSDQL